MNKSILTIFFIVLLNQTVYSNQEQSDENILTDSTNAQQSPKKPLMPEQVTFEIEQICKGNCDPYCSSMQIEKPQKLKFFQDLDLNKRAIYVLKDNEEEMENSSYIIQKYPFDEENYVNDLYILGENDQYTYCVRTIIPNSAAGVNNDFIGEYGKYVGEEKYAEKDAFKWESGKHDISFYVDVFTNEFIGMTQPEGMHQVYGKIKDDQIDPKVFVGPNVECKIKDSTNTQESPKKPFLPDQATFEIEKFCKGKRDPWCSKQKIQKPAKIKYFQDLNLKKQALYISNDYPSDKTDIIAEKKDQQMPSGHVDAQMEDIERCPFQQMQEELKKKEKELNSEKHNKLVADIIIQKYPFNETHFTSDSYYFKNDQQIICVRTIIPHIHAGVTNDLFGANGKYVGKEKFAEKEAFKWEIGYEDIAFYVDVQTNQILGMAQPEGIYQAYSEIKDHDIDPKIFIGPDVECKVQNQ